MKKILMVMLVFVLTSCAPKDEIIPLIIYDYQDLYMQDFENMIIQSKQDGYTFESYDSKNSQVIQNEIIEDAMEGKFPLLVVNPVDRLGVYPIIEKAKELDTPIIFINREPLKSDLDIWNEVYYVGAKAEQSAQLQAEIVMDLFGGNGQDLNSFDLNGDKQIQVIILKGEPGHQDAEIRTDQVIEYLEDAGFTLDILSILDGYFSKNTAYEEMMQFMDEGVENLELVISNNDAMALGAIEALSELGYFEDLNDNDRIDRESDIWLPVIGIDGIPAAVEMIETGYLYGTVLNDSEAMAEAINELIDAILNNRDLSTLDITLEEDTYIWIPYQKFTP